MGLFNKKNSVQEPSVSSMPSIFMNDDSEGDHGKESMLDYQLSYLLRIANLSDFGNDFAQRVLMKLIGVKPVYIGTTDIIDNLILKSVRVWKQWQRIDLVAEVEADCGDGLKKYVIVVENKAYTTIHDDQLSRYSETIEEYYKGQNVKILYWVITFFDNDTDNYKAIGNQCKEAKGNWNCISFGELADLTEEELQKGTYNNIIDEFWIKSWS